MKEISINVPKEYLNKPFKKYSSEIKIPYENQLFPYSVDVNFDGYSFPLAITEKNIVSAKNSGVKPALITDKLIEKLQDDVHKITFTELEKQTAKKDLEHINYYRISAFRKDIDHQEVSYTDLISMYDFDQYLHESLSRLTPAIEIYIKTSLARFLSTKYDDYKSSNKELPSALAYLDSNIYKKKQQKTIPIMLSKFAEELTRKIGKDSVITHHVNCYQGYIPIWVLFEELTLGEISMFITKLDKKIIQDWGSFFLPGVDSSLFYGFISTIRLLRNATAHGAKIYGEYFPYNPAIHKNDKLLLFPDLTGEDLEHELIPLQHTFFVGLLTVKRFYMCFRQHDQEAWNNFLDKIENRVSTSSKVSPERMGFPKNWQAVLQISY